MKIHKTQQNSGYVYILYNSTMPDIVKIGKTTKEPDIRAKELSNPTGVPAPFTVAYKKHVIDIHYTEKCIHNIMDQRSKRVSSNREFFFMPLSEAIYLVDSIIKIKNLYTTTDSYDIDEINTEDAFLVKKQELSIMSGKYEVSTYLKTNTNGNVKKYHLLRDIDRDNNKCPLNFNINDFDELSKYVDIGGEWELYYYEFENEFYIKLYPEKD